MFLLHHVTLEEASQNGNLGTRYVYIRVDAECGRGRVGGGRLHTIHPLRRWLISSARTAVSYVCYSTVSILLSTNPCDMCKSSLRHIHDPVLLSQERNNTSFFLSFLSLTQVNCQKPSTKFQTVLSCYNCVQTLHIFPIYTLCYTF